MRSRRSSRAAPRGDEAGASTVELALALPLLLVVLMGAVQFALVQHAQTVVEAAAIEGARHAAAEGAVPADGVQRVREHLVAGLGPTGESLTVTVQVAGDLVVARVSGSYPLFIPWIADLAVPLDVTGTAWREEFRDGP